MRFMHWGPDDLAAADMHDPDIIAEMIQARAGGDELGDL
jgi:hypothetical protein